MTLPRDASTWRHSWTLTGPTRTSRQTLALPGVGPYATAHLMLTALGRYGYLVLDSWTRPTYARLRGRKASDATIRQRFRKYGREQGLAFWLTVTQDWLQDPDQ